MKDGGKIKLSVKTATLIVRSRYVILALFAVCSVLCVLCLDKVKINEDLTSFLPSDSETRRGISVSEDEFTTYASLNVMVNDISFDDALKLKEKLSIVDHVSSVSFDETKDHYINSSALFSVSFDGKKNSPEVLEAVKNIKEAVSGTDNRIFGDADSDYQKQLSEEMKGVIALAAIVIFGVLLFTSKSYFEVVISFLVFAVSSLLNMGTNFIFGEISSITNSVAIILQLALAIDYAIIFSHRYQFEAENNDSKQSVIKALSLSIPEIFSSSLTTFSGLIALTFMQFRLGYDLGIVLSKGILCSMLTVFLLMPCLLLLFSKALKKTSHKDLVPDVSRWGRFLTKGIPVFVILLALILPFAVYFSYGTEYSFSNGSVTELVKSENREAMHSITDTFGNSTPLALIVPSGDYEKERRVIDGLKNLKNVKSVSGLASVKISDDTYLTDKVGVKDITSLLPVKESDAELLLKGYALSKGDIGALLDVSDYKAPVVDLLTFLFGGIDSGTVELTEEQKALLDSRRKELDRAVSQLKGKNYSRIVISSSLPAEGEQSEELIEAVRGAASKEYGTDDIYVIGDMTSARDLKNSYKSDSTLISLLSALFVFVILLFTFKDPLTALILVFVIQSSIWINFSIQYVFSIKSFFITNMIVSAIQMGATVDYAIVITSRYKALRKVFEKREAMAKAVSESFPTVITSGAIMAVAGLLIAFRVSDVYVGHIGFAVGRGAVISVILVLTVLPQLIVLLDKKSSVVKS